MLAFADAHAAGFEIHCRTLARPGAVSSTGFGARALSCSAEPRSQTEQPSRSARA